MKPYPFTPKHPPFRVKGWDEIGCLVPAQQIVRHVLTIGETGSGKTASAVIPLLNAIQAYPEWDLYEAYFDAVDEPESDNDLRPALFVVDPKAELESVLDDSRRKVTRVVQGKPGPVLYLFEGRKDLTAQEAVDFILAQSDFFVKDQARTSEPIWALQAANIIKDIIAVDMALHDRGMVVFFYDTLREKLEKHNEGAFKSVTYNRENYFQCMASILGLSSSEDAYPLMEFAGQAQAAGVPMDMLLGILTVAEMAHVTRSGVLWTANGILDDLASEEMAACVSLNPIQAPEKYFSVMDTLNDGDAVVYVPSSVSVISDMIGRCIKAKFFEFVFIRENQKRPFFYVVDEAHRFLTAGVQDGEQSLLDRCRAYRAGAVLATQSFASMAHKMRDSDALSIITNNCATSLFFRTSDIGSQNNLFQRIPAAPMLSRPHVLSVRPLGSLGVGRCYALLADGSWGLFQVRIDGA